MKTERPKDVPALPKALVHSILAIVLITPQVLFLPSQELGSIAS